MKFETALQNIIPRTTNVTSFRFPRPEQLAYKPGQYLSATLRHQEKELTHYFSFSSSPTEKYYIEFTKRLSNSPYSKILRNAKVGEWARIDGPYGTFTFEGEYPKVVFLAGGIGITPFISICKNATDKGLDSQMVLFFACRSPSEIPFEKELKELAEVNRRLRVIFTVNEPAAGWKGLTGNIDITMVKNELPDYSDYVFYACGPPPMVKAMEALIEGLGLPKEKLKLEYITGYP